MLADQAVDVTVERRGEQHPLAVDRRHADQRVDGREEAEVAQVVGLVEDGHLDVVDRAVALLDQVLQAAGGRDDDVGAVLQRADLAVVRRTAVDRGEPQLEGAGQRGERAAQLLGQLAGGDHHHRARVAGAAALAGEPGEHGDAEGEGLAGAGLGAAEDVVAGEAVGDDGGLDRRRGDDPLGGQRGDELGGQAGEDGVGGGGAFEGRRRHA